MTLSLTKKICAVVVTYNRIEKLRVTIDAYLQTNIFKIVIVNNASDDGTKLYLSQLSSLYSCIEVLNLEQNIGGAGGFAAGIDHAVKLKGVDWLVLSDDDSYPEENTLIEFDKLDCLDFSLICSAVFFPTGEICPMNRPMNCQLLSIVRNIITRTSFTAIPDYFYDKNTISPVLAASFVGLFININSLKDSFFIPDSRFFIYWDDIAFCLDARSRGLKIGFYPLTRFVHDCNRSSSSMPEDRYYYFLRNGFVVLRKLPYPIKLFAILVKPLIWLLKSLYNGRFSVYRKAYRDSKKII